MKPSLAALLACLCLTFVAPAHAQSKEFKAGGGIYFAPTFPLTGHRHEDTFWDSSPDTHEDQDWKFRGFNPGFGIFGEYALHRHVLLGLEAYMAFVKIKKTTDDDGHYVTCGNCQTDVMFSLLLRLKIPFKVGRIVSLYPIVGFGLNVYDANRDESIPEYTDAVFAGLAVMGGFGVEVKAHRVLSPFAEFRYMFGAGWHTEHDEGYTVETRAMTHTLALLVGVRFP